MEFPVKLNIGQDQWFPTTLKVRQTAQDVFLDFGETNSEPILSDRFSSFSEIDIFESEPPKLVLSGAAHREILFQDSIAVSNIWFYLQKLFKFTSVPGPGLSSRKQTISKLSNQYETKIPPPSPLYKKRSYAKIDPLVNIFPEETSFQFTSSSSISFISLRLTKVEKNEILKILDDGNHIKPGVLLSSLEIGNSGYSEIYRRCLIPSNVQEAAEKYKHFRTRWTLLTTDQWKLDKMLRRYITELEFSIESSEIKSEILRKILADALISFYFFRSGTTFSKCLFKVAEILIETIYVGAPSIDTIYDRDGQKLDFETASSNIFWAIHQFSQKFIDNPETSPLIPSIDDLYYAVHDQLAPIWHEVPKFLDDHDLKNLSFFSENLSMLFLGGRSLSDCQLMLAALLLSPNHRFFLSLFTAALIAELSERPIECKVNSELYTDMLVSEYPNINLRVILFNVDNLAVLLDLNKKKQIQNTA